MSTPTDGGGQWQQPGQPFPPGGQSQPPGYGTPPASGPYGQGQPAPYEQPWLNGPQTFRPSGGLRVAVIVLSVLLAAVYWLSALLAPSADRAYEDAVAEGRSTADMVTAYDLVGLLTVPILLAAWIVTCVWLGRARSNALRLNPQGQRRSAVWVWLGWIVPIVSLWFPRQILNDTIQATGPAVGRRQPIALGRYWAAWIAMSLLSNAEFRLTLSAKPQDSVIPALEFAIAIVTTVALVLWVGVVREVSDVQDVLASNGPTDIR
jgi:hypothetical protein